MRGMYLFIETSGFMSQIRNYFGVDEAYAEFQAELAEQPDKGTIIPGARRFESCDGR